ncbi:MAG: EAL domain-containing protein [Clostridiales bacterium]|jgi:PAS domain S-box-containing protein|nr:EAL domain-containing protein [Clostridiales bacterium]
MTVKEKRNNRKKKQSTIKKAFDTVKDKRILYTAAVFLAVVILLATLYLGYSWDRYGRNAEKEAIALSESLTIVLPVEHISELTGNQADLENHDYNTLKISLADLKSTRKLVRFTYLYTVKEGNLIFLVDSEDPGTEGYSPPGEVFSDTSGIFYKPLKDGVTVITPPRKDRWGEWISVLVPVYDRNTGVVIAAFAMDYPVSGWFAGIWLNMIPDIIIVLCILVLSSALIYGWALKVANIELSRNLDYDEALYRGVFEQAPIGIAIVKDISFIYSSDFGHSNINPMFEKIMGRSSADLANLKWTDITHPEDLEADLKQFNRFRNGEINGYSLEKRFIKPDGKTVWVNMTISRLTGITDSESKHLCLITDITDRKETEGMLKEVERRQSVLLSHLPGLAYRCYYDREWTMQFVSDGCYDLTGYRPESLIENRDVSYKDIITPEYREDLWNEWKYVLENRLPFKHEYEITTASGERKWVIEMGQGIYAEDGRVEALEGIVLDISDRKAVENNLRYINEHDRWTGLFNRDSLEKALKTDARLYKNDTATKRALVGINLSLVQLLTANYGFQHTQSLVKSAAVTLNRLCGDKRKLYYTYENRFVFYLTGYSDKVKLLDFAEKVARTLENLFVTDRISGGIGILEITGDDSDANKLLRRLLVASEKAINRDDKNFNIYFYDDNLEIAVDRENQIIAELEKIAGNEEDQGLFLLYQPIVDLKTNKICGFEALARLNSRKLGYLSPLEFIPVAEKTKLIVPVGEKVITEAFRFLHRLKETGCKTVHVSINISAIQLLRPDFIDRLFELIDEMKVDPTTIGIEITESVFASDYEKINRIISRLKQVGIMIAIDDFGTGYSSLSRVRELNVNCLKIDKYFIDKLLKVSPERAITSDIISMAHKLGHCTVAEGLENEVQKEFLISCGCDKIQGYHISKPLEEEQVIKLLCETGDIPEGCNTGK